ncbi:MAG: hypothetical protein KIT17_09370 [Rubrivivax sp.]|nr:hypothetical protein [Burkholderiales bacterium]MCW5633534.1 hypothetical protein [Rubrivivax sp.]
MPEISLNPEQRVYVISCDEGSSCFGFDNARDHTNQIAELLHRPDLAFGPEDHGFLAGYEKYGIAVHAWSRSPLASRTYFDPGTDPKVAAVLERCRRNGAKVRLILGDPGTGESWLDEYDVVGHIGRSAGLLKVPLIVEPGEDGGPAILTACILAIVDWQTGRFLFRHSSFREPELSIERSAQAGYAWDVLLHKKVIARFRDIAQAGGYVAFMRGATVELRVFR